jgi:prephenate dehydratase
VPSRGLIRGAAVTKTRASLDLLLSARQARGAVLPLGIVRLAHLGPAGTFGEMAAISFAPDAELIARPSHASVVTAVSERSAAAGVLAIENSLEGSVTETLDLLIHETDLAICAEVSLAIEHCLLARPGTSRRAVNVVYSHPQALAQCRQYLDRVLPAARVEAAVSTVAGVERALAEPGTAAIGSRRAAEILQAEVIDAQIQDRAQNVTRFVVVAPTDPPATGCDKTSLAFKTEHDRPGTLVDVLTEFSGRGINLTKIESRPTKDQLGVYVFLIDLEGHRADPIVASALAGVRERTSWLKVLGSYPRLG